MKKYNLVVLTLFVILNSCGNFSSKNEEINLESSLESEQVKNVDNNFPITFNQIGFLPSRESNDIKYKPDIDPLTTLFETNFNVLNNTKTKILNLTMDGFIELQFAGEELIFYPRDQSYLTSRFNPEREPLTESNYREGLKMCIYNDNGAPNYEIIKESWMPNTQLNLNCTVYGKYGRGYGYSNDDFKRTPIEAVFVIRYKATGVDGEYSNFIKYDILDKWKERQTNLGFRDVIN